MKYEIFADVSSDGTLSEIKRKEIGRYIKSFAGKRISLTIERKFNKRSSQQNRFLHGIALPLIQQELIEVGWNEAKSMEWVKDFVKVQCLTVEVVNKETGQMFKSIRPTSGLTTSEFMDLISSIQQWSAENLGLYIPDPNEQVELEFK